MEQEGFSDIEIESMSTCNSWSNLEFEVYESSSENEDGIPMQS